LEFPSDKNEKINRIDGMGFRDIIFERLKWWIDY